MPAKILIVDDAMFMRTVLKEILQSEGYEVAGEASNGQEAIELAKELQPDIVTLDITMPDMDGVAALPKILEASPASKVVMCTAMGQQKLVVEAIKLGARDFVVKPFTKSRVIQAIENALEI